MTYRLYGDRRSGSSIIEMALAHAGADYAIVDVEIGHDRQREAEYAAINPQRKLPSLITPSGETLTESVAILLVLDERHREAALLPRVGSPERAQALRWLLFMATELYPIVEINDYPERFAPDTDSAPRVREIARSLWRERWQIVERAIAGDPWLLPSGFCITDVYIAVVSRWAQQAQWRPAHLPRIERIAAAVAEHPTLAPVWQRHFGS